MVIKNQNGFTLVEMILVVLIFGILASVALPKFINLSNQTEASICAATRRSITSALNQTYTAMLIDDPTRKDWLANTTMADLDDSMFATGFIPTCPANGTLTIIDGNCVCSLHGR